MFDTEAMLDFEGLRLTATAAEINQAISQNAVHVEGH
jgi:hypothetical protein